MVTFIYCTTRNQWLWEQLCKFSWRWACGPETCRDPSIHESNWNSDISWFFISYAEKMHGTKSLKFTVIWFMLTYQWWIIWFMDLIHCLVFEMEHALPDHPMYLVCPDVFRAVGESSYGIQVGFIGSTHSIAICLRIYLFICIWGAKSTLVYLIK